MKIGIIGADFIGRALAALSVKAGHDVMISNSRAPVTLGSTAVALRCRIGSAEDAANFGDVVVLAIPFVNYAAVPATPLTGKIVIDANNYYPQRDGHFAALDTHETTTSEVVAEHLSGAKVVKMFNAILQGDLESDGRPKGSPDRRALPMAGDDPEAKRIVAGLVDQFGFDVVDAGPLSEGWRFERAKPAYCIPLTAKDLQLALAAAERNVEVPHGSWRS